MNELNWPDIIETLKRKRDLLKEIKDNMQEQEKLIELDETVMLSARIAQWKKLIEAASALALPEAMESAMESAPQEAYLLFNEIAEMLNIIKIMDRRNIDMITDKMKDIKNTMSGIAKERRGFTGYFKNINADGVYFDKRK